jgi:type VI secretion system protein ImpA
MLAGLLTPIAGPHPSGEDLSFSVEFDQITELRREDDPTLDQGEWVTQLKVADWPGVSALCERLLRERSKDLRLAMWLTEAWALQQGYPGLSNGLRLCHQLCEQFWDDLHPRSDDGDQEQRAGNLRWLLQKTVALADSRPITRGRQGAAYSLRDLQASKQTQTPGESPALSTDQFMRALKETPAEHLQQQVSALEEALAALQQWQTLIDARMGDDGPSFVAAREALQGVQHELLCLLRDAGLGASNVTDSTPTPESNDDVNEAAASASRVAGPIQSRAQALQQLREVAAYFRRTEPHSPVAYLADKAVRWGDMPLHEWLRHVVKDQGAMAHLEEMLGLERPHDDGAH